jgi:ATP-dependent DNA ligase
LSLRPGAAFASHIEADGPTVFAHARKLGLEDIVSKRKDWRYVSGRSGLARCAIFADTRI